MSVSVFLHEISIKCVPKGSIVSETVVVQIMAGCHYSDIIMSMMVSRITGASKACSTIYSGEDRRKYQSSASLAFVRGIHR